MSTAAANGIGRVIAYASARLVPMAGHTLTAEAISIDYQGWCAHHNFLALRDGVFREEFAKLALQIDLKSEANDADRVYRDVAFVA